MRKTVIILIFIVGLICCRKTDSKCIESNIADTTGAEDILEKGSIPNDTPLIFPFDSAQVQIISIGEKMSLMNPFIFHFQSPEGGKIVYTTYGGRRYTTSISREYSVYAFKALDTIFIQKSVPIIVSKKETRSGLIGYTPSEMIVKIFRKGDMIVNKKIVFHCEADGWDIVYSQLFKKFSDDLFSYGRGTLQYWDYLEHKPE